MIRIFSLKKIKQANINGMDARIMAKAFFPIVLYYLLIILLYPTFDMNGDIVLNDFFSRISNIASIILFVLELLLPIIFKCILKKDLWKTLIYCFISFLFFIILELAVYCIIDYHYHYSEFSTERWNDRRFCYIRHFMLDDLRKNYVLKGKSKEDIYKLLGKIRNDRCHYQESISENSGYYKLCYKIDSEHIYFCLSFDEKGTVEKTYQWDAVNSHIYDES